MDNEKIYFHADDYGVSLEQSVKILSCYSQGALNSISVLPNVPQLGECLRVLEETDSEHRIRRVLHLNFVEGKPVAEQEKVNMLVDETGYFACSFVQLLKWSYSKKGEERQKLKNQLKAEIIAQIDAVTQKYDYHITAIDSHQHYHMIPIVMEALLEVLDEKSLRTKEIRIPVDPVLPLLKTSSMWFKVPLINWVKWGILRIHADRNRKLLQQRNIDSPVFFGIFFTCEMKMEVVEALLPQYKKYAKKRNKSLELMFHPGNLTARYELLDERSKELEAFYMSDNRFAEAACLKQAARLSR